MPVSLREEVTLVGEVRCNKCGDATDYDGTEETTREKALENLTHDGWDFGADRLGIDVVAICPTCTSKGAVLDKTVSDQ